jgi:hypothetical protein
MGGNIGSVRYSRREIMLIFLRIIVLIILLIFVKVLPTIYGLLVDEIKDTPYYLSLAIVLCCMVETIVFMIIAWVRLPSDLIRCVCLHVSFF